MPVETASVARTGMQLVNTSANRLHCQSAPSAALVGDVRLTESNAATQANNAHPAISATILCPWVGNHGLGSCSLAGTIRWRLQSICELNHILTHIFRCGPNTCGVERACASGWVRKRDAMTKIFFSSTSKLNSLASWATEQSRTKDFFYRD